MIVDVFHDTVCPWCRIGKKHLDDALAAWDGPPVTVRWRPFFLQPGLPSEGRDFRAHMAAIKGDANLQPLFDRVTQVGATCDLTFRFDRVTRAPNTLLSHRLLALTPLDAQGKVLDALHRAYFEEGRDIGRRDSLVEIAAEAGLDAAEIGAALAGDAMRAEIEAAAAWARAQGVSGVPLFVFDGALALSGAQPAPALREAMRQASRANVAD